MRGIRWVHWWVGGVFLLILTLVFGRALFLGEALLPAEQLAYVLPWQSPEPQTPWNILRFDGITQFYPWRLESARQILAGHLPLVNPYAFSSEGGTPLLANSQSAPLYPLNAIFWLLGPERLWYGFGLSAAVHLLLLLTGTYRLGRALGLQTIPATFAAAAFALSAPVTAWLSLPTFLAAIAWLPWLLLAIRQERPVRAGIIAALTLLSGHLQLAAYVLLTAGLYTVFQATEATERRRWSALVLGGFGAVALAVCLAAPQVLPAVELGRISHRGGVAATMPGFSAYQDNAIPLRHLFTLVAPDFFGHPHRNNGINWLINRAGLLNNYAEWAIYFGVAPLLAAASGLALRWRRSDTGILKERRALASIAGIAGLMAFGTPINLLFYFGVPGFAATGNPGRVGVIAVFALCLLAGIGLQEATRFKPVAIGVAATAVVAALCAAESVRYGINKALNIPALMQMAMAGVRLAIVLFVLSTGALLVRGRLSAERQAAVQIGLLALSVVDLLFWSRGYNPTSPPSSVFPETPGIAFLKRLPGEPLVACLNASWSLDPEGPAAQSKIPPVLPPNALTVFQVHDIGGYDSLFLRETKERITAATGAEPSPAENGNLVFIKTIAAARTLGARYLVMPPMDRTPSDDSLRLIYKGADLMIYENPAGLVAPPTRTWTTGALRVGLFLGCLGLGFVAATRFSGSGRKAPPHQS